MKTGKLPLTNQNRTLWAYELVDNQLQKCLKENGSQLDFSFGTKVGQEAIMILKEHSLVTFSSTFLLGAILTITDKGKDVISAGGIQEYLKFWKIKKTNYLR